MMEEVEKMLAETELLALMDLPLGQRALRAGFKQVTPQQLRERFACDLIQDRENQRRLDELKQAGPWDNIYHFTTEYSAHRHTGNGLWTPSKHYHKSVPRVNCSIRTEKLDHYLGEIPDRVYQNLQRARKIGLSDFEVAYPIMEEAPQKDPVLVARLGDNYIEIDYWE